MIGLASALTFLGLQGLMPVYTEHEDRITGHTNARLVIYANDEVNRNGERRVPELRFGCENTIEYMALHAFTMIGYDAWIDARIPEEDRPVAFSARPYGSQHEQASSYDGAVRLARYILNSDGDEILVRYSSHLGTETFTFRIDWARADLQLVYDQCMR